MRLSQAVKDFYNNNHVEKVVVELVASVCIIHKDFPTIPLAEIGDMFYLSLDEVKTILEADEKYGKPNKSLHANCYPSQVTK